MKQENCTSLARKAYRLTSFMILDLNFTSMPSGLECTYSNGWLFVVIGGWVAGWLFRVTTTTLALSIKSVFLDILRKLKYEIQPD